MKHPVYLLGSALGGLFAGALAMYYLDSASGGRRRAMARDKMVAAGHDAAHLAWMKSKRSADRLKGMVMTRRLDRVSHSEPAGDPQLHERIRSRLGRVVSHPKAVEVDVREGCVRLRGNILSKEVDGLMAEIRGMAGVHEVRSEMRVHESPEHIPDLQGSGHRIVRHLHAARG